MSAVEPHLDLSWYKRFHLKIGIGTGATILRFAENRPREFFVGVEQKLHVASKAIDRCNAAGVQNVNIMNTEAHNFVKNISAMNFFSMVHIYFPTPEFSGARKSRTRIQNPLITREFLIDLSRVVRLGGIVKILTDVEEYFEGMQSAVLLNQWWPQSWEHFSCGQFRGELIGTPCERRFRSEGRTIRSLQLKRIR